MSRTQTETHTAPSYTRTTSQRINRLAIWSLVLSIITLGGAGSIAGIWLGAAARRRIPETGERGYGLAAAGIVIGVVTLIIAIAYWIFIAMHTGGGGAAGGTGGGGGGY